MNNIENRITNLEEKQNAFETIQKKLLLHTKESDELLMEFVNGISNVVTDEVNKRIDYELEAKTQEIKKDLVNVVDEKIEKRGLTKIEADLIKKARENKVKVYLGRSRFNDKYTLYASFFYDVIAKEYYKHFNVISYSQILPSQLEEAIEFIANLKVDALGIFLDKRQLLDKNYKNKVWEDGSMNGLKMKQAYERYYHLV